jgi:hypothetical protein
MSFMRVALPLVCKNTGGLHSCPCRRCCAAGAKLQHTLRVGRGNGGKFCQQECPHVVWVLESGRYSR